MRCFMIEQCYDGWRAGWSAYKAMPDSTRDHVDDEVDRLSALFKNHIFRVAPVQIGEVK